MVVVVKVVMVAEEVLMAVELALAKVVEGKRSLLMVVVNAVEVKR